MYRFPGGSKRQAQGKSPWPTQGCPMTVGMPHYTSLLGDHSEREPPDPIPNSEVKPLSADDSVAVCHAKVGNCQAPYPSPGPHTAPGLFYARKAMPGRPAPKARCNKRRPNPQVTPPASTLAKVGCLRRSTGPGFRTGPYRSAP
jgi:hypothetical protein